jgi:hypothetical protein
MQIQKAITIPELERYFPGFRIIIDTIEQFIPRPQNKYKRQPHYFGKKKTHDKSRTP